MYRTCWSVNVHCTCSSWGKKCERKALEAGPELNMVLKELFSHKTTPSPNVAVCMLTTAYKWRCDKTKVIKSNNAYINQR